MKRSGPLCYDEAFWLDEKLLVFQQWSALRHFTHSPADLDDLLHQMIWMAEIEEAELTLRRRFLPVDPVGGLDIDAHHDRGAPELP